MTDLFLDKGYAARLPKGLCPRVVEVAADRITSCLEDGMEQTELFGYMLNRGHEPDEIAGAMVAAIKNNGGEVPTKKMTTWQTEVRA